MRGFEQHAIGGNAVAFGQQNDIIGHEILGGDALTGAVSDNEGLWAGEVLEGGQSPLRPAFLDGDEDDVEDGEGQKDQGFGQVAQQQIDDPSREEQLQHWFAHGIQHDAQRAAARVLGQFVETIVLKPCCGHGGGQPSYGVSGLSFSALGFVPPGVSRRRTARQSGGLAQALLDI